MSPEAIEFLVIVLGSVTIIGGVIAVFTILEHHREAQQDELERRRIQRELNRRTADDVLTRYRETRR